MYGTLSNVLLTTAKFGLSLYPPSIKFIQSQTIARNALECYPNEDIQHLWKSTRTHTNLQYNRYKITKQVLKACRLSHEEKLVSFSLSKGLSFLLLFLSPYRS